MTVSPQPYRHSRFTCSSRKRRQRARPFVYGHGDRTAAQCQIALADVLLDGGSYRSRTLWSGIPREGIRRIRHQRSGRASYWGAVSSE